MAKLVHIRLRCRGVNDEALEILQDLGDVTGLRMIVVTTEKRITDRMES